MDNVFNKNRIMLLIVFVIFVIISLFIYNRKVIEDEPNRVIEQNNIKILKDYSRFFTVNSCIYKYVNYLEKKDVDSLLKLLDKNYIEDLNINSDNILDFVEDISGQHSFVSKEIYYEKNEDSIFTYYVYGQLFKDTINGIGEKKERYYKVILDENNQTFSIIPYNDVDYKEVTNE